MKLRTEDGLALEAELAVPDDSRLGLVVCHAHPLHGGSMRSVVNGALFTGLPALGVACLRFNFRGVEGSEGTHDDGNGERLDAEAALRHLRETLPAEIPLAMAGWSFGADVALSVRDDSHAGWFVVAPPLKFGAFEAGAGVHQTGADARAKRLVLAEHDQFRPAADVQADIAQWVNTRAEVIGGADHYFIGRTARVIELAVAFADEVTAPVA